MSTFLFDPPSYHHYDPTTETPSYERLAPEIRLSIFLITGLCVGLPALFWTLRLLYRHYKRGSKVSVFIIFLLLTDALEMVLSPYIVTKLLSGEKCYYTSVTKDSYTEYYYYGNYTSVTNDSYTDYYYYRNYTSVINDDNYYVHHYIYYTNVTCKIFTSLWSGARSCGFHFSQLVALESILSLTHPDCSAHIFSRPLSIILSIIVFLLVMISGFFGVFRVIITTVLIPVHLSIFVILCKLICTAPPSPHVAPKADRKRGIKILAVAMVTYVFFYFPGFVIIYIHISRDLYFAVIITLSLESLRVITDPLLCVLVCRENVRRQKPQTHIELNTDLRSV